ncbi:hydroxymethylglutaryl-CoA reductase, degradative [Lentilactobacillus sp. SPB1-3]|uniref:Hydroxymethylglutaryl-CoA reductase, degradative n=1 Tax=Lentilactobacillus terminaliae TaxID=3003483 RepID=A0ACD5DG15_9LACO|nr:hydroxymethylglutaryl-CoA reductase, degradative [Lentilactobacillus sp. SPB1-3]MCZ0977949.1 hydroxymethylglutaryl-CoA reductase, degradative [Lentilactobacillus sp. SPB1-3]
MNLKYNGFYKHDYLTRLDLVLGRINNAENSKVIIDGNYDSKFKNIIENYLTNYQLPEGIATNLVVNDREYMVPMVTEEPSVIAACSNGSKLLSDNGGISATVISNLVDGQIILKSKTPETVEQYVTENQANLVKVANLSHPSIKNYARGALSVATRRLDGQYMSLDVTVDAGEAMGANIVNSMLEAVKSYLQDELANVEVLMAILTNDSHHALVKVKGKTSLNQLSTRSMSGKIVGQKISEASYIAKIDAVRATTHNKGIMNGIDAAAIALGNDWRALESAVHSFAVKDGRYQGLTDWQIDDEYLVGEMTIPIPIGFIGGATRVLPLAKINQEIAQVSDSEQEMMLIASVGLAQNLAALKALVTEGIQRGHMGLAVKSAVIANGATPDEVEKVVKMLAKTGQHDSETIKKVINNFRKESNKHG